MTSIHNLKTDPDVFAASWFGEKEYEIRFDDRDFKVGDRLILRETEHTGEEMKQGKELIYTGRMIACYVTHKLNDCYGLKEGWCILDWHVEDYFENNYPKGWIPEC